jgi:hypothetical protein
VQPERRLSLHGVPPATAVVDAAIVIFGDVLPCITSTKHRTQLCDHLAACVRTTKPGPRKIALQLNVALALVAAWQRTVRLRLAFPRDKAADTLRELLLQALVGDDPNVRVAASEALAIHAGGSSGNGGTVVPGGARDLHALCIARLQSERDVSSRTGYALLLGGLYRHATGAAATALSSPALLQPAVSLLCALSGDAGGAVVQQWALFALSLVAEAAGFDFQPLLPGATAVVTAAILSAPSAEGTRAGGKALFALMGVLGPDLAGNAAKRVHAGRLIDVLDRQGDARARLVGLRALEQFILFAPTHVDVAAQLPRLRVCSVVMVGGGWLMWGWGWFFSCVRVFL